MVPIVRISGAGILLTAKGVRFVAVLPTIKLIQESWPHSMGLGKTTTPIHNAGGHCSIGRYLPDCRRYRATKLLRQKKRMHSSIDASFSSFLGAAPRIQADRPHLILESGKPVQKGHNCATEVCVHPFVLRQCSLTFGQSQLTWPHVSSASRTSDAL